jgi:hypothetical protein
VIAFLVSRRNSYVTGAKRQRRRWLGLQLTVPGGSATAKGVSRIGSTAVPWKDHAPRLLVR